VARPTRAAEEGHPTLLDPSLFASKVFRYGVSGQTLQQISLGGLMIALPIYLQMVFEYNALEAGLSLAPLSLTMFAVAIWEGKPPAKRRAGAIMRIGFGLLGVGAITQLANESTVLSPHEKPRCRRRSSTTPRR
jgi:hypothetical protein